MSPLVRSGHSRSAVAMSAFDPERTLQGERTHHVWRRANDPAPLIRGERPLSPVAELTANDWAQLIAGTIA